MMSTAAEVLMGPKYGIAGMILDDQQAVANTSKHLFRSRNGHQWFYGAVGNDQAAEVLRGRGDDRVPDARLHRPDRASRLLQQMLDGSSTAISSAPPRGGRCSGTTTSRSSSAGGRFFGGQQYFNDDEFKLGGYGSRGRCSTRCSGFTVVTWTDFLTLHPEASGCSMAAEPARSCHRTARGRPRSGGSAARRRA